MKNRLWIIVSLLFVLAAPASVQACSVCMGDPNSQTAVASDAVLWTLLALVGFIFIATGATAYYIYHHARKF